MTTAAAPATTRLSPFYLLIGLAVVVGVVASFLAASAPATHSTYAGQLVINVPQEVWGFLYLSPLIAGFTVIVFRRLTEPAAGLPGREMAAGAIILVLLLVFVYVIAPTGSNTPGSVTISKGGGSGTGSSGGTGGSKNNSSLNGTSVPPIYTTSLSTWELVLAVFGISAGVAVLALPGVLSRISDRLGRRSPRGPDRRARVQAALSDASAAIGGGEDPREAVVRLYVRLLDEIAPRVGDVTTLTAEEIRTYALDGLGVRGPASEALTRLFEEARYSAHPIGSGDAARFRDAIGQVQADLVRGAPA